MNTRRRKFFPRTSVETKLIPSLETDSRTISARFFPSASLPPHLLTSLLVTSSGSQLSPLCAIFHVDMPFEYSAHSTTI